ncbi:DMT family transporter [Glaciecola siphonariae]|uniref:DMT family transporter n=1 Tax=Glaciecola siphonariae TaxID=521012 RepID=A0ABV9LUD3_9ALTE
MLNSNVFLFSTCVLIWGSTWIAITFQTGETPVMVSVALRFAIAAVLLGIWCKIRSISLRIAPGQHKYLFAAGVFLYCMDYSFLYAAEQHMISALLAVLSSSVIYFNVVLRRIILGKAIRLEVIIGATIGLLGIALIFAPEFEKMSLTEGISLGLLFATASFLSAAFGNITSERILDRQTGVIPMNFWAMSYGVACTSLIALFSGMEFSLPDQPSYYYSLVYLSVFGSVLAFGSYMKLLKQIGSDKAAYVVLVYPVVALIISTFFEAYLWTQYSIVGVVFVIIGNAVAMGKANRLLSRWTD